MKFLERLQLSLQKFMIGRHGLDHLSLALTYAALLLCLLSMIPGMSFLNFLSLALLVYTAFRILSRNREKRIKENVWFMNLVNPFLTRVRQAFNRFRNRKLYRYFDCPNCHQKLRVPRGVGHITVTCKSCGHKFDQTA